jgi:PhnB protein
MPTPEGKIGIAEMCIGDTIVMLAHASTAEGISEPMPATVVAYVEDADKVYQRALGAGTTSSREPQDMS